MYCAGSDLKTPVITMRNPPPPSYYPASQKILRMYTLITPHRDLKVALGLKSTCQISKIFSKISSQGK